MLKILKPGSHASLLDKEESTITEMSPQYIFSIVWEPGPGLVLFQLQGSTGALANPPQPRHAIITETVADNDGEISISVGRFPVGTILNLWWGVSAIDGVQRCSAWLTNRTTGQIVKLKPSGTANQSIAVNGTWIDNKLNITLF
jgi:hypothetical protein